MSAAPQPSGPDLSQWTDVAELAEGGRVVGQVAGEEVMLVRSGGVLHAIAARCSHYGGPLVEGEVFGHEVACPWHHARFDLRTGAPTRAPAINPLRCWSVERDGRRARVLEARPPERPQRAPQATQPPSSVVIVGAGAAGNTAAETLRAEGYEGPIVLLGGEATVPVDRPNLSKDYLAGGAPEEWMPLRDAAAYSERKIDLRLGVRATRVLPADKRIQLSDGSWLPYDALVLATGAQPVRLAAPGAELPHVFALRTLADSRAIIARAQQAKSAVVVGSSFIGLEVAASLRARALSVDVVGLDAVPLARVLGRELGELVRALHEEHGVRFHLGQSVAAIDERSVTLTDGTHLPADLVVAGIGVRPDTALAEEAGCKIDRGVVVDEALRTSVPGIWAAGDVARFPERRTGRLARIEHWAVAQQQGRAVARSVLGRPGDQRRVPFFWSQHYDLAINFVGWTEGWEQAEVIGDLAARNCLVAYRAQGRVLGVASIGRDRDSLLIDDALDRGDDAAVERVLAAAR